MIESIIDDEPAIVRFVTPLADVDVVAREKSVMLLHEACHAWAYTRGQRSSRSRVFHPLTEPCVKVSPHTALHTQGRFYKLALMGFCSISEQISL